MKSVEGIRGFRLVVGPGRDSRFGVALESTCVVNGTTESVPVVRMSPFQTGRVMDAVFAAIRASGRQPSILAATRRAPVDLGEAEGVRLALVLLATKPVVLDDRVRAIAAGIAAMSVEEAYYWYAKCISRRLHAVKALRVLLADDK